MTTARAPEDMADGPDLRPDPALESESVSAEPSLREVPGIPGLLPFENLTGIAGRTAVAAADRVLGSGWSSVSAFPPLPLDEEIPWGDTSPERRSWIFSIHSFNLLQEVLLAHSQTGDAKYLVPAIRVTLDWVSRHDPARDDLPEFAWYDMAVGRRVQRMAYVLDAGRRTGLLDAAQQQAIHGSLVQHREYLENDDNIVFHTNHGFYQVAGQLALGRRFGPDDEAMAATYRQGCERFLRMIDSQFTAEGVHREHSPAYHWMVYDSLSNIIDAGLVSDDGLLGRVRNIERALAWFVLPSGDLVNFGDTDLRSVLRTNADAALRWRDDAMRFVASGGRLGVAPAENVRVFPESGYFVARDRWPSGPDDYRDRSYLAQAAAFHSRTHKHADDLGFVWHERGQDLLVDAGRYGYLGKTEQGSALWEDGYWYSDPYRVYCESTAAHNTVEIDGRNYQRKGAKPYGSAIGRSGQTAEGLAYCETEVRQFRSVRHARVLVFKPGQWLLVFDWLQDNHGDPHDFRQWFHFGPALTVLPSGTGFAAHVPGAERLLRVNSLTKQPLPGRLVLGRESPTPQGFFSPREGQVIPNYAVAYESLGTDWTSFATLFCFGTEVQVDRDGAEVVRSGRNASFAWRCDGVDNRLRISRPADGELVVSHTE